MKERSVTAATNYNRENEQISAGIFQYKNYRIKYSGVIQADFFLFLVAG
jgi:hypothetical protein